MMQMHHVRFQRTLPNRLHPRYPTDAVVAAVPNMYRFTSEPIPTTVGVWVALSDNFGEILLSLYRAAREAPINEFQREALEIVRPSLRFTSAQWGSGPQNSTSISKRSVYLYNDPPDAAAAYEEIKDQDEAPKYAWKIGNGVLSYNVASFMPGKARAGIRVYARRLEHENVLIAFNTDTARSFTRWLSFYRADGKQLFCTADEAVLSVLTPHLWEALAINRVTHLEHVSGLRDEQQFALGIADRDGKLCHAETRFAALLRTEFGEHVGFQFPQSCVDQLLAQRRYVGRVAVFCVAQEAEVLFLKARALVAADQLTHREREVAALVVRGFAHKKIARSLHISPATTRNHIQAIHRKLGVHNTAELAVAFKTV